METGAVVKLQEVSGESDSFIGRGLLQSAPLLVETVDVSVVCFVLQIYYNI